MKLVTLDPTKRLQIYQRIARDGKLILRFFDALGMPKNIGSYQFTWNFKLREGQDEPNILQLTSTPAAGLVIGGVDFNELTMTITKVQAALFADKVYFQELLRLRPDDLTLKDWITGDFISHDGRFDGVTPTLTSRDLIIDDGDNVVNVTLFDASVVLTIDHFRGGFDPSANLFPETGGSGGGGAIQAGDHFYSIGSGILPDNQGNPWGISLGTMIMALDDLPAQDFTKWRVW